MHRVKESLLTVYLPVPADPDQLANRLKSCGKVHTGHFKGERVWQEAGTHTWKRCFTWWSHYMSSSAVGAHFALLVSFVICLMSLCSFPHDRQVLWYVASMWSDATEHQQPVPLGLSLLCHRGALQAEDIPACVHAMGDHIGTALPWPLKIIKGKPKARIIT